MGKTGIIIQREFNQRVRKKSFILTTILTPLAFLAVFVIMGVLMAVDFSDTRRIAVVDSSGIVADGLENNRRVEFLTGLGSFEEIKDSRGEGRNEDLFGILVIGEDVMTNPRNVQLYTYSPSTIDLEMSISGQIENMIEAEKLRGYDIENIAEIMDEVKTDVYMKSYRIGDTGEESESSSGLAMAMSYILGLVIYFFIFMYGAMVMQGVIEEKNSKVIEIIVSSVRPYQLMMGKIIGIAAVAITQFAIWVTFFIVVGMIGMQFLSPDMAAGASAALADGTMEDMAMMHGIGRMDSEMLAAMETMFNPMFFIRIIGWFLVYFLGGYLLYAGLFAAVGSAVSNETDAQQLQWPVTIPLLLAFFLMINVMRDPNSSLAVWGSMIPFTSPIIMMARIPYGVPTWEILVSVGLLVLTFLFFVWFASKIYRVGIFMYGKKPTFKEIIKWSRYKY